MTWEEFQCNADLHLKNNNKKKQNQKDEKDSPKQGGIEDLWKAASEWPPVNPDL